MDVVQEFVDTNIDNSPLLAIPPGESVEGLTQAELGDEWWKYVFSIPGDVNPLFDQTGENAHIGQSGSIFFLSGASPGVGETAIVERSIAVPTDQLLFFPLLNFLDNTFGEEPPRTEEEVFESVNQVIDNIPTDTLFATIDGEAVPNLEEQRQISPQAFEFTFPENNLFGLPGGAILPDAVSGGYWLLLNSLPAREEPYIINFGGTFGDPSNSSLDITYIIQTYNQIIGGNGQNHLVGTELSDEIDGLNGSDLLIGNGSNDALDGGNGSDTLNGVDPNMTNPGLGEIDRLKGGNGPDTFILGDVNHIYYNDSNSETPGLSDYGLIVDLKNEDVIQLQGDPSDYALVENLRIGSVTGTGIFLQDSVNEIIGIVEGVAGLNLNSNSFSFV